MIRKKAPDEPKDKLILVTDDNIADIYPAMEDADSIRAGGMAWPKASLDAIPISTGGKLYLIKATAAAKIEAAEVAKLKRSAILAGLFSGVEDDRRSISTIWPWLVVVVALIIAIVLK